MGALAPRGCGDGCRSAARPKHARACRQSPATSGRGGGGPGGRGVQVPSLTLSLAAATPLRGGGSIEPNGHARLRVADVVNEHAAAGTTVLSGAPGQRPRVIPRPAVGYPGRDQLTALYGR